MDQLNENLDNIIGNDNADFSEKDKINDLSCLPFAY